MKIAICASMAFSEKMIELKSTLEQMGHVVLISAFAYEYAGRTPEEKDRLTISDKHGRDAIREHWDAIQNSDAILVLNYDRKGIDNYIGGNTLMEIGFAYILRKKIFLLQPVPKIEYYQSEIEAVKPIILNGNLGAII